MKEAYTSHLVQNRQKDEIVREILAVCNGGSLITRVMFHAYIYTFTGERIFERINRERVG
jgi:predicted transcriptional regulator